MRASYSDSVIFSMLKLYPFTLQRFLEVVSSVVHRTENAVDFLV